MRLIDVDALPNGRVEWEDIENAPTVDPPKELVYSVTVTMDTDEVIGRLMERGWGPVEHGRWIYYEDETIEDGGRCSVCGGEMPAKWSDHAWRYVETEYCPHCGAMMDEEADHDDHL